MMLIKSIVPTQTKMSVSTKRITVFPCAPEVTSSSAAEQSAAKNTVTISGTNDTPVASAAIASVIEDTQITTAGTLPPPRDIDIRDSVSFVPQPLSAGTYGTLTLAAGGTYTYTLNNSLPAVQALGAGETLTDTFTYTEGTGKEHEVDVGYEVKAVDYGEVDASELDNMASGEK